MDNETDWFPTDVKPVREGVYRTKHLVKIGKQIYNEGYSLYRITPNRYGHTGWCWVEATPELAAKQQLGSFQHKEWKGLKSP